MEINARKLILNHKNTLNSENNSRGAKVKLKYFFFINTNQTIKLIKIKHPLDWVKIKITIFMEFLNSVKLHNLYQVIFQHTHTHPRCFCFFFVLEFPRKQCQSTQKFKIIFHVVFSLKHQRTTKQHGMHTKYFIQFIFCSFCSFS